MQQALEARHAGRASAAFEDAYLKTFSIEAKEPASRDLWFRGLAVDEAERGTVQGHLPKPLPADPLTGLSALYGRAQLWRGVLVIGPKDFDPTDALEKIRAHVCPAEPCVFWNPAFLTRLTIVAPSGLAAYRPSTDSLVLSRELLEKDEALHRFVVVHELTHLAERAAGKDWGKTLSKVQRPGEPKFLSVEDELTKQSAGSPYSLLPDGVAPDHVVARGYREAKARHDRAEEVADTVAAFLEAPARFCRDGKPIAPKVWRWVQQILRRPLVGQGC